MPLPAKDDFVTFLHQDLALPGASIELGLRQAGDARNLLPMVLWQYGLVTLQQLDQIFDWLEARAAEE